MPRPKTSPDPTRSQRWDERVLLDCPPRRHGMLRLVTLVALVKCPRAKIAAVKRVILSPFLGPDERQEEEAVWDHIEGTLTQWAMDEGAVQAYRTVLPTLLKQRFGKVPARVARRIKET